MRLHRTFMQRAAFGVVAAAMTAITFGAFVIAPATMGISDPDALLAAVSKATVLASAHAATGGANDMNAMRARRPDSSQCMQAAPARS